MPYFLVVLFILFPGSVWSVSPDSPSFARVSEFILFGLELNERGLGKPKQITSEKVENIRTPGQIDERQTLNYDGITLYLYKVNSSSPRVLTGQVVITRPKFKMPFGIKMGESKEKIQRVLGKPDSESEAAILYEGEALQVELTFKESQLVKVVWTDNGD